MKRKLIRRKFQIRNVNTKCVYCESKSDPDYKNPENLYKYLTERGKILSRSRTGLCNKHQKKLTKQVKYARHLALLPFMVRV